MKKKIVFLLVIFVFAISMQSCFLLTESTVKPSEPLGIGSKVGDMTIVWINESGSWKFLAMGKPSASMQWANTDSTYLSASSMSPKMGMGKGNTLYLTATFNSQAHTTANNAAKYCRSKDGWLPSRAEAKEVAKFANTNFWVSNSEPTSKAFYYDSSNGSVSTTFRTERSKVVTIPVYYLDENGNKVNP